MTRKQQDAAVALAVMLAVSAVATKAANKQAAALGIPMAGVAVLGWLVTQAIK
ncbi:hypothetical protein ABZX65_26550 [Streptomyces sp. NPDC003300]|uniref:hypothetical protein n=1 Tax=unclassified Streptomyces TaxID=2593676 RepID=UPI0033A3FD9A